MSWIGWVLLVAGVIIVLTCIHFCMGNPRFWKLVKDNPDAAYNLFLLSGCLVDQKPEKSMRDKYAGPFRFMTSNGATHVVYIPGNQIIEIQKRMTTAITGG